MCSGAVCPFTSSGWELALFTQALAGGDGDVCRLIFLKRFNFLVDICLGFRYICFIETIAILSSYYFAKFSLITSDAIAKALLYINKFFVDR
jgi:hypothetical protein